MSKPLSSAPRPQVRYQTIYQELRARLERRDYPPSTRLPTERDLGVSFGASRLTVARALKCLVEEGYLERRPGSGTYVTAWAAKRSDVRAHKAPSPDTVETANAEGVADTIGDSAAPRRRSSDHRVASIALLMPYSHNWVKATQVKAIFRELYAAAPGCALQLYDSDDNPDQEAKLLGQLLAQGRESRAVIASPYSMDHNQAGFAALVREGKRLVFVDRHVPGVAGADRVSTDNYEGAVVATRTLIERGHQRIAFLYSWQARNTVILDRRMGYERALLETDTPLDLALIREAERVSPGGSLLRHFDAGRLPGGSMRPRDEVVPILREWLSLPDPPTAIFCANDCALHACLLALRDEFGRRLPEDMEVAGFGDCDDWLAPLGVPFLAVRQPVEEMGTAAVRLLLRRLAEDAQNREGTRPLSRPEVIRIAPDIKEYPFPALQT